MKIKMYGRNAANKILILFLVLSVGMSGCGDKAEKKPESTDPIMNLVNQSSFFDKAPEELAFGNAIQETDSDRGVTVKYLASFFRQQALSSHIL